MTNWAYFPRTEEIDETSKQIIEVFKNEEKLISSEKHTLKSDEVLKIVSNGLSNIGFIVENSKKKMDKIRVPVLYGLNGKIQLAFEADAYLKEANYVIEVEAGRAVLNYQFLKDFYEACMMSNIDFLCIAVRNIYNGAKDFDSVYKFFDAMYSSRRMDVPLKGILIIGY